MSAPVNQPSFVPSRRFTAGFSVLVSVAALLAIVILANYLAVTRLVWRHDFSSAGRRDLSPLTLQTLAALTNEVKATVLFNPNSLLLPHVDALLRDFATRQPKLSVQVIDYLSNPDAATLAKVRYQLGTAANDLVVFESGGRQHVVPATELSIYNDEDLKALMAGQQVEVRRSGFRGEQAFASALAKLADGTVMKAAYLQGHGEHPGDSEEPVEGYAKFLRLLVNERNLQVEPLRLGSTTNDLPADCQLLIIAGPTQPFLESELGKIEAFLQRGGRLFVLLHPYAVSRPVGLENLLAKWGILCPQMYAGDTEFSLTQLDLVSQTLGTHPLMAPLRREEGSLYFPLPRVVSPMPPNALPADAPKADVLVLTSTNGLTKSDVRSGNAAFNPARDRRGLQVPLAVAAEKGGVTGVAAGRGTTRLVVIGDSTMFGNVTLDKASNRDFAGLCTSWLLDRPQALAIGPKPVSEYRLSLTRQQLRTLNWILLGALPGSVLALGFAVWMRRRA